MCGRLNIIDNPSFTRFFQSIGISLDHFVDAPRYNIAPTSYLPAVFSSEGNLDIAQMKWGLTPPWIKPGIAASPLINARSETIQEKPSFRRLFTQSRVVIPVTGFYEWQRRKTSKRAFHFQAPNSALLLLAGIWQISKEGEPQCCIATTSANAIMRPIHHRMPVLLDQNNIEQWLKGSANDARNMLQPSPDSWLSATEVSSYVNNARNQSAQCIAPLPA